MKNLKIGEISSSGQKQGENTKIGKFPRESGRLGSYANAPKNSVLSPIYFTKSITLETEEAELFTHDCKDYQNHQSSTAAEYCLFLK